MTGMEVILPYLAAGAASTVLSAALAPKPPKLPDAPKAIPMADEAAVAEARKRATSKAQSRTGRSSTILSDDAPVAPTTFGG